MVWQVDMKTFSQFIAEVNRSELYLTKKEEEKFKSLLSRAKSKKKRIPDSNYRKEGGPVRVTTSTVSEENEAKTCPAGKYWCFTSKKCKKIPLGYYIGARGYLEKDDEENKSNGNGNGNGNGDSGSDGGGDGGGGMGESYISEISAAMLIRSARVAKNQTGNLRAKLEPGYKAKRTNQSNKFAVKGVKKLRQEREKPNLGNFLFSNESDSYSEDYKKLPRDRMEKQYDRKKDKNYDEFHKQNPMGMGPNVSRGKSDTNIDKHGNSRQTKKISGQLKNNPRFYDSSHEQWQRMQSRFKSKKNSAAAGEVARKLNPGLYSEGWSAKYKKSIDCNNPKGFSQKAHCQGRKKKKL